MVMSRVGGSQLPNISQKGDRGHVQGDEAPRRTEEPRFISRNVREVRLEFALQCISALGSGLSRARSLVLLLTFTKKVLGQW